VRSPALNATATRPDSADGRSVSSESADAGGPEGPSVLVAAHHAVHVLQRGLGPICPYRLGEQWQQFPVVPLLAAQDEREHHETVLLADRPKYLPPAAQLGAMSGHRRRENSAEPFLEIIRPVSDHRVKRDESLLRTGHGDLPSTRRPQRSAAHVESFKGTAGARALERGGMTSALRATRRRRLRRRVRCG
jgi:hypothetical protein